MLRPELTSLPVRIARLPLDSRGYPVPWFVAYVNGEPDFRAMDRKKWVMAVNLKLCWVCGGPLGAYKTFVIGPMCGINRTTGEPPCHLDCAMWSVVNCPFLTRPHMRRQQADDLQEMGATSAGIMITRNPGVTLLWTTKSYKTFSDGKSAEHLLIQIGMPTSVTFWAEGRPATRAEIDESIEGGYPLLYEQAEKQDKEEGIGSVATLAEWRANFEKLLPV